MNKTISILFFLILTIGLLTTISDATEVGHEHQWSSTYVQGADRHWKECLVDGCLEKKDDGAHVYGKYKYVCDVCKNYVAHEHYSSKATCTYGGKCEGCGGGAPENPNKHAQPNGYGEKIDANSHKIICDCGHVFVKSEPHNFPNEWSDNGDGTEERWCKDCLYAVTRKKQSSGSSNNSGTSNNSTNTHTHSYSKATCVSPAKCSCGATTGSKNTSNHTGGTVVKGKVEATYEKEGYSGDTYCKSCDVKIKTGKVVAKKVAETTDKKEPDTQSKLPETMENNNVVVSENNEISNNNATVSENESIIDTNITTDTSNGEETNKNTNDTNANYDKYLWLIILLVVVIAVIIITVVFTKKKKEK